MNGHTLEDQRYLEIIGRPGNFGKLCGALEKQTDANLIRLLSYAATNSTSDVIRKVAAKCHNVSAIGLGQPPLHYATERGQVEPVQTVLELGANVNALSKVGYTALHLAVTYGNLDVARVLLRAGADVHVLTPEKQNALHVACEKRPSEALATIAQELLKNGADMEAEDLNGKTPLMYAIAWGNSILVNQMFRRGVHPPKDLALRGRLLQHCHDNGHREILELLLSRQWESETPLTSIDFDGNLTLIDDPHLLSHARLTASFAKTLSATNASTGVGGGGGGASTMASGAAAGTTIASRGSSGNGVCRRTVIVYANGMDERLHLATKNGHLRAVERNLTVAKTVNPPDSEGRTPLHVAAEGGHCEILAAFLEHGAVVDSRDKTDVTPLYLAAAEGHLNAVRLLVAAGAKLDLSEKVNGHSPLMVAIMREHHEVVEALLDAGASPGTSGEKGDTALHLACKVDTPEGTVASLLGHGALPGHCWNEKLQTPLHWAASWGKVEAARQLIQWLSPRQINMRDKVVNSMDGGETPLLIAVRRGHVDMVKLLLDNKADPTIRTGSTGFSPLVTAASNIAHANTYGSSSSSERREPRVGGDPRIIHALVAAGASVEDVGGDGMSPLHMACYDGSSPEVVQAVLDNGADPVGPCASLEFLPPLHLAAHGGSLSTFKVLLGLPECGGIDALGPAPARLTPLSIAVMRGHTELVRFLLEEGADMNKIPFEEDGTTPASASLIHTAACAGHGDVISLLLQAKIFKEKAAGEKS